MEICQHSTYLVLVDIASAVVQMGSGSEILNEARYSSRRRGKWSVSTNIPKWAIDAGYSKFPVGGGMCYVLRPLKQPCKMTYEQWRESCKKTSITMLQEVA